MRESHLIISQSITMTGEKRTGSSLRLLWISSSLWCISKDSRWSDVRIISFDERRSVEETRSSELLRICELQEEIKVTNEDPDNSKETSVRQEHVESEEDPRKVHSLKSRTEPEAHDDFFVELTPDVKN